MSGDGYNGWASYPTWACHLWITNEPGPYGYSLELAAEARSDEAPRAFLADALRDWLRPRLEPASASLQSDLLGYALDQVQWFELADAFLEADLED